MYIALVICCPREFSSAHRIFTRVWDSLVLGISIAVSRLHTLKQGLGAKECLGMKEMPQITSHQYCSRCSSPEQALIPGHRYHGP